MKDIDIVFSTIKNSCLAIYYGGSHVDPVIDNPHDYDYICFAKYLRTLRLYRDLSKQGLRTSLSRHNSKSKNLDTTETSLFDFSQIRSYPYTQITWFSYLDPLMIKVIGEDVCPKTDIIHEHRAEFIKCLKEKATDLTSGRMLNQKRWYHILRGVYILLNNSYDVTPEQRREINILHDQESESKQIIDKTIKLLSTLN